MEVYLYQVIQYQIRYFQYRMEDILPFTYCLKHYSRMHFSIDFPWYGKLSFKYIISNIYHLSSSSSIQRKQKILAICENPDCLVMIHSKENLRSNRTQIYFFLCFCMSQGGSYGSSPSLLPSTSGGGGAAEPIPARHPRATSPKRLARGLALVLSTVQSFTVADRYQFPGARS